MDEVRLPDLETIRRFSIAVRREHAPVDEVVDALKADLETILRARGGGTRRPAKPAARSKTPARKSRH